MLPLACEKNTQLKKPTEEEIYMSSSVVIAEKKDRCLLSFFNPYSADHKKSSAIVAAEVFYRPLLQTVLI